MKPISIAVAGVNLTTGATSVNAAIPPDSSGQVARAIRISVTANAHVAIGLAGRAAVATDMLVTPNQAVVVSIPRGTTHVCAIQNAATGTVNVVPLENC